MIRKRLEWLSLIAVPVFAVFALLHLNAQVAQSLQSNDVAVASGLSAADIDALNEPILRDAEERGALSPYVDPKRIDLPIETLHQLALDEAQNSLGLRGEPVSREDFYITQGQWLTLANLDIAQNYLPDRTMPVLIMQYRSNDASESRGTNYSIVVDATTGEVISTSHGPGKTGPIDVNIKDRGYLIFDTALTPQAPLPIPTARP